QTNKYATALASVFGQTPSGQIPMFMPETLQEWRRDTDALNQAEWERDASVKLRAQTEARPDTFVGGLAYSAENPSVVASDLAGVAGTMAGAGVSPQSRALTLGAQAGNQAAQVASEVTDSLLQQGYSEHDARSAAADAYGVAFAVGLVVPQAIPGGTAFEGAVAGQAARLSGRPLTRAATAAVGEPLSEMGEEGAIQAVQNIYSNRPVGEGVGGAAAMGLTAGLSMAAPGAASQY